MCKVLYQNWYVFYSINEYEVFVFLVQAITNGFLAKMTPCLVSSSVLCERLEERQRLKGELIDPRICSLPQVVFTAAFLKTPSPAPDCLLCCRLTCSSCARVVCHRIS